MGDERKRKKFVIEAPCELGDTVYHITTCRYFPQVHDGTLYDSNGGPGTATGLYCPCELSETCPFDPEDFDCEKNKDKYAVFKDAASAIIVDELGEQVVFGFSGSATFSDFGRIVFLDEQEAKEALEKLNQEGEERR